MSVEKALAVAQKKIDSIQCNAGEEEDHTCSCVARDKLNMYFALCSTI